MKHAIHFLPALVLACASHTFLLATPSNAADRIVVANRASGDISLIDTATDTVVLTLALPGASAPPEPMYASYSPPQQRLFVGDRANNCIVAFDATDMSVDGVVPTGAGVFHMWNDPAGKRLWVNNDIDNTATVIDPETLAVLATVPMPADLVADGGKPHDVVLSPSGNRAYVTMIGLSGPRDWVLMYETRNFQLLNRAAIGKDPHVSLHRINHVLYVPSQGSNLVTLLNRTTLDAVGHLDVPGAHGAAMAEAGDYFYTTNLPGGGPAGLFTIELATNTVVGAAVDTPFPVPHNLVVSSDGAKLYVTHSGATADKVSIYDLSAVDGQPSARTSVTVGLNPFGITRMP